MVERSSTWEEAYRSVKSLWELEPDHALREYATLVPDGTVLDLGVGDGRNALFFAKMGYEVEGVDISQTAIELCVERAKKANLKVKAEVRDLKEVDIPQGKYSLIIAAWVLNFFKKTEAEEIIKRIRNGLKKDGFVYIGVFSINDPSYERATKSLEVVEECTFFSHYFTKEEVLSLFAGLKVIYCAEGMELNLGHGDPHYHGFIEYMGQMRISD
ncbi:class I SAM-dependent methyltransferase [Dehalococcoidia bacterium]|nr:class I SAM-dependent methyltransferase [Dehalococcoidia bacterium]MCL0056121.1 class I SAM-dependent methyltransferase [Dehalococcoidia bacterium]MCL0090896.1 class I SAM-dependent methyltransferase [Dehalococcoidia bacterium]